MSNILEDAQDELIYSDVLNITNCKDEEELIQSNFSLIFLLSHSSAGLYPVLVHGNSCDQHTYKTL